MTKLLLSCRAGDPPRSQSTHQWKANRMALRWSSVPLKQKCNIPSTTAIIKEPGHWTSISPLSKLPQVFANCCLGYPTKGRQRLMWHCVSTLPSAGLGGGDLIYHSCPKISLSIMKHTGEMQGCHQAQTQESVKRCKVKNTNCSKSDNGMINLNINNNKSSRCSFSK